VLRLCFLRLRKDAASGVDGVTFQEYEKNLEANLADLVGRLKRKAYRRGWCDGSTSRRERGNSAFGIPTLEDKLLQTAVTQLLLAIYEVDFLPCSYGYRPGLGAHDAIKALTDELQWADTISWWKRTSRGTLSICGGTGWSECWGKESRMEPC